MFFFLWITSGLLENYAQGYSLTRTPKTGVELALNDCLRMEATKNSFQSTMQSSSKRSYFACMLRQKLFNL